jgi:hypothetical protein
MNLILIAATMIALPVGKHLSSERNTAKYVFTETENLTKWPTSWAFMLAWMSPIWTIGDYRKGPRWNRTYTTRLAVCNSGSTFATVTLTAVSIHLKRLIRVQKGRRLNWLTVCCSIWNHECHRQTWHFRNEGPPLHAPFPNGPIYCKNPKNP